MGVVNYPYKSNGRGVLRKNPYKKLLQIVFLGVEEKSSSEKKFESLKKSNFLPLKLFSSIFWGGSYGSKGARIMADHSF